jgi:hypothetical protein
MPIFENLAARDSSIRLTNIIMRQFTILRKICFATDDEEEDDNKDINNQFFAVSLSLRAGFVPEFERNPVLVFKRYCRE